MRLEKRFTRRPINPISWLSLWRPSICLFCATEISDRKLAYLNRAGGRHTARLAPDLPLPHSVSLGVHRQSCVESQERNPHKVLIRVGTGRIRDILLGQGFETKPGRTWTVQSARPPSDDASRHIRLQLGALARGRPAVERTPAGERPDPDASCRRWLELSGDGPHQGDVRRHGPDRAEPAARGAGTVSSAGPGPSQSKSAEVAVNIVVAGFSSVDRRRRGRGDK